MIVQVTHVWSDRVKTYTGTGSQIASQIMADLPFLANRSNGDIRSVLEALGSYSHYNVDILDQTDLNKSLSVNEIEPNSLIVKDMLGFDIEAQPEFVAAKMLAGGKQVPPTFMKECLKQYPTKAEAALAAYGFPVDQKNLAALANIQLLGLHKSEDEIKPVQIKSVVAYKPEGEKFAQAVIRAVKDGFVFPVTLAGKHSKGAILARDQEEYVTYILKPGFGASPDKPVEEESATQSQKEVAFYHAAKLMGLDAYIPQAELLLVDGQQYACIKMLHMDYQTMERIAKKDPNIPPKLLLPYLQDGTIHRWAIMDYILGQGDRNGQNIMGNGNQIRLIDHGSALAGPDFDPGNDKYAYVPYYLRVWAPHDFAKFTPQDKIKYLPGVPEILAREIKGWLDGIQTDKLAMCLARYGVNPEPSLGRLMELKNMAAVAPIDEVIDTLWVT